MFINFELKMLLGEHNFNYRIMIKKKKIDD